MVVGGVGVVAAGVGVTVGEVGVGAIGANVVDDGGEAAAPVEQAARTVAVAIEASTRRNRIRCIERTVPFRSRNASVRALSRGLGV